MSQHFTVKFPVGVMMVVVTGGELFTSNTALLTAAVIEKKISLKSKK